MSLSGALREQARAWASMPVSLSRLLSSAADAAEAGVGVLQQMERQSAASARVLEAIEGPVVRLADAVDGAVVQQTVDALARLPGIVAQASVVSSRVEHLFASLETPLRALGPLGQALDGHRLAEVIDRIDQSLPGLVRLPQTEGEVQLLRETTDRLYRLVEEVQGRFLALPGAGLLLGRSLEPPTSTREENLAADDLPRRPAPRKRSPGAGERPAKRSGTGRTAG